MKIVGFLIYIDNMILIFNNYVFLEFFEWFMQYMFIKFYFQIFFFYRGLMSFFIKILIMLLLVIVYRNLINVNFFSYLRVYLSFLFLVYLIVVYFFFLFLDLYFYQSQYVYIFYFIVIGFRFAGDLQRLVCFIDYLFI